MVAVAALLSITVVLPQGVAVSHEAERLVSVIVQGLSGTDARAAVDSVEGRVTRDLPIIDGVAAVVSDRSLSELRTADGVRSVTPNTPIRFEGKPVKATAGYQPASKTVRSDQLMSRDGNYGQGVTIALLDTGVYAQHPDLRAFDFTTGTYGASRVVHCEDFTGEQGTEAHCADTFGHGTFMAGLMAGNGSGGGSSYLGTAPEASIVSLKLAGYDGSSDVSRVLAAIQWAVAHKDAYSIDVMNLSLGTDASTTYRLSPLNYAVQRAWAAGMVVVVAAGNTGPNAATVMKPADDPYVITVGAANDQGTSSIADDDVPVFSGRGATRSDGLTKPDVVAPGVKTISLRSPGSAIDQKFPGSVVEGSYFRGTGTSMAAAVASGVAAQLLRDEPALTPDQVKARLMDTARPITVTDPNAAGRGLIDAYRAARSTSSRAANSEYGAPPQSSALGLLDTDRGSVRVEVQTFAGELELGGEFVAKTNPSLVDVLNPTGLVPWMGAEYTLFGWEASNWTGSNWTGSNWTGSNWTGSNWTGSNWTATAWTGSNWTGSNWTNSDWTGSNWTGSNWTGSNWTASNWTASNWTSAWYAAAWD